MGQGRGMVMKKHQVISTRSTCQVSKDERPILKTPLPSNQAIDDHHNTRAWSQARLQHKTQGRAGGNPRIKSCQLEVKYIGHRLEQKYLLSLEEKDQKIYIVNGT
jgi:hypothetical protein